MKAAGADVFVNTGDPEIRGAGDQEGGEIDWKPLHILSSVGNSVGAALKPAGPQNAKDIVSDFYFKDPTDPQWKDDPGYLQWVAFMDKYYPAATRTTPATSSAPSLPDVGAGAEAMRRRPQPRECHEAGGEPQKLHRADAAPRDRDQHQPD